MFLNHTGRFLTSQDSIEIYIYASLKFLLVACLEYSFKESSKRKSKS